MELHAGQLLVLLFGLILCTQVLNADRRKRQIIFEEDERANHVSSADCRTVDNRPGRCIRLTRCPALRQTTNMNQLRRYFCGFEGDEPKVCCPQQRGRITSTTITTTTRRPTTPRRRITTRRPNPIVTTRRLNPIVTTRRPNPIVTTRRPNTTPEIPEPKVATLTKPRFLPEKCGKRASQLTDMRVVGGKEADPGSWPWMAVVFIEKRNGQMSPDCGGALVTTKHVVTAAHCVVTGRGAVTMDPRQVSVRLGAHDLRVENEAGSLNVGVEAIRKHEEFDPRTYRNDIAVLKLRRPVRFTDRIKPVCLPYDSLRGMDLTGTTVFVIGFGTTSFNGPSSDVLRQAGFNIQSQESCRQAYERELNITRVYLCAGDEDGSMDSCQGDSGGPLNAIGRNASYYLVGIVSFGKLCAQVGYPGVYTRVTEFLDWLARNLSD